MESLVRILHLEDDPRDAELIQSALEAGGLQCEVRNVGTREEFEAAVAKDGFDAILSDYKLPNYTGFSALEFARRAAPDVPFILLSGTVGEELAVESLRAGATDYLLKDRLNRLVPAVQRAISEARGHAEKKRIETQFLRNQRMESIGALAGGIAHDLNNILAPIIMAAQLLRQKLERDDADLRLVDTLEASAQRGAGMVRQVLTFARGAEGERTSIQPRHLLSELRNMIAETFPRSIEIKQKIGKDLWSIKGDATQLYQVLMNLAVNARDAMPNGGTLELQAANVTVDEELARAHPEAAPGRYVVLSTRDTGTGIPPEVMARIFEPFFTTKEPGKGTGLGLSTVGTIVKNHAGFVVVQSELGKGTEFRVYLPKDADGDTAIIPARLPDLPAGEGELILVADDELALREIARMTLEHFGYRVCTAADGTEAVNVFSQRQSEVTAVVTDLMMPFMDGAAAINAIRKLNPEVKFIVCTGLSEVQENVSDLMRHRTGATLLKPYKTSDLLLALHRLLHPVSDPGQISFQQATPKAA